MALPEPGFNWLSRAAGSDLRAAYPAHEADVPGRPHEAEQLCLDCGRLGTQLMRDSLGRNITFDLLK